MLYELLYWAVFTAFLPTPATPKCIKANESQCQDLNFAPGIDLAGEGFDITTMQRKGAFVIDMSTWLQQDKSCTVCQNPFMGMQKQKLPVSVLDWRASQKCKMKVSSSVYHSSEELVSSSTSSIANDWKSSLDISKIAGTGSLMLAGSKSKLAEYSMAKTKKDKFSFTSHSVSCGYYSYRVSSQPPVHPDIKKGFEGLPQRYDEHTKYLYFKLIDIFGTHYLSKVTMGGAIHSVTSIKDCQASVHGTSADEVKTCLDVEASASVVGQTSVDMKSESHHCKEKMAKSMNKRSFSNSFSDRETDVIGGFTQSVDLLFSSKNDPKAYKEWLSTLPRHPEVLSYSLEPIHELIPSEKPSREHLRNAIKDYILQRGLWKNCTSRCKTGIDTNPKETCSCTCHNKPGMALNCCPTRKGLANVVITAVRAKNLYGDYFGWTDGYVKILHGKQPLGQTPIIPNENSPEWNFPVILDSEDLTTFRSVTLEVWDEDSDSDDDLLGTCVIKIRSGVVNDLCVLNHGELYYKVKVTCLPSLAGSTCTEYKPSPMEAELEKVYVSRNARPVPRNVLSKMGVLLDERIPQFNQSSTRKVTGFYL